jgi:hypothetical protein
MRARWLSISLMAVISMAGLGQSKLQSHLQDRFVLTAGEVARALSAGGIQTREEQVSLLTRVVSTESSPALDVLSVEPIAKPPMAEHSSIGSRVRLGCHLPGECLPFYAIVSGLEPPVGLAANSSHASAGINNPVLKANMDITMRAGTHATLLMDDNRAHIQVSVICLENGITGHRIHVASPDHKQIYLGEVVNANLLRGSF